MSSINSSRTGHSTSSIPLEPANFASVIQTTHTESGIDLPPGRKRRSRGTVLCKCTRCLEWSSGNRNAAYQHVKSKHPLTMSSSQSIPTIQRSISSMLASQDLLRTSFNEQRYKEAIIGLLTRRRVPFLAVEWSEMRDLALACNPAIEDLLITSRRTAVRLILANYDFYYNQIKASLSSASSPIHIASDLWTSPHRHAMLAICAQWVDSNYKLQKALLALPECPIYSHRRAPGKPYPHYPRKLRHCIKPWVAYRRQCDV